MAQQTTDVLANADVAAQGLDGGLNLKGDPARLAPPATTRSDNAHYDTVGSVSQLPGFVSQGLNGAKHVYGLHARDSVGATTQGDVLLHGEFPSGGLGFTQSLWSFAGTANVFSDQPVLPLTARTKNLGGRLTASTENASQVPTSKAAPMFCRQEVLPSSGKRKFAMCYCAEGSVPRIVWSVGYINGLAEITSGSQGLATNVYQLSDALGIQGTNQWCMVSSASSSSLEINRFDFDTGFVSQTIITGVTTSITSGRAYQLFNHAGRTYLAYFNNAGTPLLTFYDIVAGTYNTTTIGGTLTPGFTVFSPYTHQTQSGSQFLCVVKNSNVYVLHAASPGASWALVTGATALPASGSPWSGTPRVYLTGTALINDSQGGVGGNAQLLLTVFRHLPETLTKGAGSGTYNVTNIASDLLTFVANSSPGSGGTLTYQATSVVRFPGGGALASKAFSLCPSEAYFSGVSASKQPLCLVRSNAYEYNQDTLGYTDNYTFGQPTYFLINWAGKVVGRFLESQGPYYSQYDKGQTAIDSLSLPLIPLPSDASDDQAALTLVLPAWAQVQAVTAPAYVVGGIIYNGYEPSDVTFAPTAITLTLSQTGNSVPPVQGGGYTVFSGALTSCHDGMQLAEANYHFATPNLNVVALTSGSSLGGAGTYYYVAVYEFYDDQGQLVRSTPSLPMPLYISGTFYGATIAVPCVPSSKVTQFPNRVRTKVYRSLKNLYLDKNFYLCAKSNDQGQSVGTLTVSANNVAICTDNFYKDDTAITTADTTPNSGSVNSQPRLYTGTTFINTNKLYVASPPPCFYSQTASKGRIFGLAQALGQFRLYYTAPTSGTTAPEWNFNNYVAIPPDIGDARAVEALDNQVIIFGTQYVASLAGYGPPTNNAVGVPSPGDNFDPIYPIPCPAGVIGSGAVTRTPDGLVFQGQSGIQLLERGVAVSAIGAAVDPLTGRQIGNPGQIYGRGITLPSLQSVVWPNARGPALVYSYLTKKFSTWPLLSYAGAIVQRMDGSIFCSLQPVVSSQYAGPASSTTIGSDFGNLSATVYAPICLTSTANAGLVLETPWILPAAASGGESRVWNACLTGTWMGPHTLQIEQAYDYEGYSLTRTYDMSSQPRQYQVLAQPRANTRMVAVRYRISLLPASSLTSAYAMASLADLVLFSAKQQGSTRSSAQLRG